MTWYSIVGASLAIAGTVYLMTTGIACLSVGLARQNKTLERVGKRVTRATAALLAVEMIGFAYAVGGFA